MDAADLLLTGLATHKLSRLVAKDRIMSFARAPFTEHQGRGVRRAMGELLSCPYCLGMWVSGGFHAGLLFAPRTTRFLASILGGLTISDFLQIAYRAAEERD